MTLWTPDGEREVGKPEQAAPAAPIQASDSTDETPTLTDEQQEQAREMAHGMAEARQQLLEANVADVIANHAFGIYELAAIHLTAEQPDMKAARIAIDGLGGLVDSLSGRLGEAETTLNEAVQQIRMMFVQRTTQLKNAGSAKSATDSDGAEDDSNS